MNLLAHIAHPAHIALYLAPAVAVFVALKIAGRHLPADDLDDLEDDDG